MSKCVCLAILVMSLVVSYGCEKVSVETQTLWGPDPGKVRARKTVLEKFVDVPWTTADARAMHAPPGTTATVETVTHKTAGGNANCGRAGLICAAILLLPVRDLINQVAVIKTPDRFIQATYTEAGDLTRARVTVGREIQEIEVRYSVRLNRRMIVEDGRRTVAADGSESETRWTSILKQAPHLRDLYRAAFAEDQATVPDNDRFLPVNARNVARTTCGDMSRMLGSDHEQLGLEFLKDPGLSDEVKAGIRDCLES